MYVKFRQEPWQGHSSTFVLGAVFSAIQHHGPSQGRYSNSSTQWSTSGRLRCCYCLEMSHIFQVRDGLRLITVIRPTVSWKMLKMAKWKPRLYSFAIINLNNKSPIISCGEMNQMHLLNQEMPLFSFLRELVLLIKPRWRVAEAIKGSVVPLHHTLIIFLFSSFHCIFIEPWNRN